MFSKHIKVHTQGTSGHPVLLFLHAFPFSSDMWKDQMHLFSEKFLCIALDIPGFGKSSLPGHAVTFEYYVDAVIDYLKEQKIEKSIWCGLSMGGYLALRMYEREPNLCQALILCDTKSGADSNEAKIKRTEALHALNKNRHEFTESEWKALVGKSSQENEVLKKNFEKLMGEVSEEGIAAGLVALATRTDTTEGLTKISVPTLVVVGEEDKVTPVSDSEALLKAIGNSQLKKVPHAGHLSNLENPQGFNDHLAEFLLSL